MSEAEQSEAQTVQEYYEESFSMSDQELKENNAEADTGEVCGTEARGQKVKKGDEGYVDIGTAWISDGVCYDFWIVKWLCVIIVKKLKTSINSLYGGIEF